MGLKPMLSCQRAAIIVNRHGEEVILDIGIGNSRPAADKATAFKLVAGSKPPTQEEPLRPDNRLTQQIGLAEQRDGLGAGHLEIKFQMILQIRADAGPVRDNGDAMFFQLLRRADA